MLDAGASVNFYMFYGGTNFGFTAGANDGKYTEIQIQTEKNILHKIKIDVANK